MKLIILQEALKQDDSDLELNHLLAILSYLWRQHYFEVFFD